MIVLIAVGIGGYAVSRRTPVGPTPADPTASSDAVTPPATDTIFGPFDPQELEAARRAFDQKIADEEREAKSRNTEIATP